MRVLVTGGAGYIGAHTCEVLSRNGIEPVAYDNLSTGHFHFVKWGPFVRGDTRDSDSLQSALKTFGIDAVIHFAAHSCVGESVTDPQKYYQNNVVGTISLLNAMLAAKCMSIVFSSTCAVYGNCAQMPITEDAATKPITPYGASKLMVENILNDYRAAYGLRCTMLRYFNAAGASSTGLIGEYRQPETHLIPRAMMAIQGHTQDFQVFGSDFPTQDGTAIRDYVHVTDLAEAHVAAIRLLVDGSPGDIFNLGTGRGYSVRDVLHAIYRESGTRQQFSYGPRRAGDPSILVADTARALKGLGWSATQSDLQNIVRSSWAWHTYAHPARPKPEINREPAIFAKDLSEGARNPERYSPVSV